MSTNNIGSEIYSGASEFGKLRAIIGVVLGTLFGVIFIIGGIALIMQKVKLSGKVQGTIVKNNKTDALKCYEHTDQQQNVMFKCVNVTIDYEVENKTYTLADQTIDGGNNYKIGDKIDIYYNPSNPEKGQLKSDNFHMIGWVGLIIGILLLIGAWFQLWVVRKYKFAAAAEGVGGAIDIAKGVF
jgi:hypothetical protein